MAFRSISHLVLLGLLVGVVACSTTTDVSPEPVPTLASACESVPALVATRLPPVGTPDCKVPARTAAHDGCATEDANACFVEGFCMTGDWLGIARDQPNAPAAFAEIQRVLNIACQKGLAEACVLRAGAAIETGTPVVETCPDVIRACQLGDETGGCLSCIASDCG